MSPCGLRLLYANHHIRQPMRELDTENATGHISDDDDLLMQEVICGEAELLYLDTYLREILQKR